MASTSQTILNRLRKSEPGQKIATREQTCRTPQATKRADPKEGVIEITPSCPVLIIFDDDPFRRLLVKALDQRHFTVTVSEDGAGAVAALEARDFPIVLLGLSHGNGRGLEALRYIRDNRPKIHAKLVILAEVHPDLRQYAGDAVEFLIRPVDPAYLAARASAYCP